MNENNGWVLGSNQFNQGTVYKTNDGGTNWTLVYKSTEYTLNEIFFTNNQKGWMIGNIPYDDAIVLTTDNGGAGWTTAAYLKNYSISSICFIDSLEGYLCGANGKILKSIDGGYNWAELESGTNQWLSSINFIDRNNGWVVGDHTVILKTTNGGTTLAAEENFTRESLDFSLFQNYPNPFNSSTIIKYKLPVESNVKLNIYNLLGQKVSTLTDENKSAGTHEIEFDCSDLPSGVYFFRIEAGNFADAKKLILIK